MMSLPHRSPALLRVLLLYPNEILAALAAAFILQAGLVPFDFQFSGAAELLRNSGNAVSPPAPLHDIVGNLFLFVPLGLFMQVSAMRHAPAGFSLFLTLLAAAVLSAGLESIQAYSPSRVSSIIDVCCNIGGAAIGAVISITAGRMIPKLVGAAMFEFRACPAVATLKAYVLVLILIGAVPFTFAFDAPRFKLAIGQTVLVPFGCTLAAKVSDAPADTRTADLVDWGTSRRWARWMAEAASFALLTWLLQLVLRDQYGFSSRSAAAMTWWLTGVLALGLSVGQFLVITRGLDTTDPLFRLLGVGIGLAAWPGIRAGVTRGSTAWLPCRAMALASAGWIILSGLAPFRFRSPHGGVLSTFSSSAFLPFMAYFQTRTDQMLTDVMEKVISYAILAGLMAGGFAPVRRLAAWPKLLCVTAINLALASAIECAQMFLPVRVVSLTDLVLAAVGSVIGVMLHEHVASLASYILHHQVLGPGDPSVALPSLKSTGWVDRVMGQISEPDPNAPREPGAAPREPSKE